MKSARSMSGRRSISLFCGAALAVLLAGCDGGQPRTAATSDGADSSAVVEVVNGEPVSGDLLEAFAASRRNLDLSKPALRDRALKQIADFVLLEQAAKKAGYLDTPEFVAAADLGRLQAVAQAAMRKFGDPAQLDEKDIRAEYERQHAGNDAREYNFDQMTFANKEAAARVVAEVSGAKTFAQVMQAHRGDADVRVARNFAKARSNQLAPEISAALALLKPGGVTTTPVQVPQGWAMLHLVAVDAAVPPPYDEVKENLRRSLARRKAQERLTALRADAKITDVVPAVGAPAKVAPAGKPVPAPSPVPAKP